MSKTEYTPKRKWRIECTEEKLRLMAEMIEDITRFLGGQPQMMNCLMIFRNGNEIGEFMRRNVRPMMHPNMNSDCVGWNGRCTDNKYVRKEVAQGYAAYKSILSALANEYDWHNVHSGRPLTCEEGGELMDVRPVDESEPERVDYWTAPVIFATFAVQRLCHVISWSWWLVTSPLWGAALLIISISVVDLILVSAADFISHRKNRKEAEL